MNSPSPTATGLVVVDVAMVEETSQTPKISVIMVSYNGRQLLQDCLRRLMPLADQWHEVLVADNGSDDGSREMVRRDFPEVQLLELDGNYGFGVANNRAAAVATGDQFLFLNSDAWLDAEALPRLSETLRQDPRLGLVAPQLRYPDGSLQFTWAPSTGVVGEAVQMLRNRFEASSWAHRAPPAWWPSSLGLGWLTAACWLVKRRAFEDLQGFDEAMFLYFEDVDLCLRLKNVGWNLRFVPQATAFHIKGGSQLGFRAELHYRRSQLYFYRQHRPGWEGWVLRRRLRKKFLQHPNTGERQQLMQLLDEDATPSQDAKPGD